MGQSGWSAEQKLEIVLAVLRGQEPMTQLCRRHGVSETAVYRWRDQFVEAGRAGLSGGSGTEAEQLRAGNEELKAAIRELAVANRVLREAQRLPPGRDGWSRRA
jgi:transposase-like protein